eukprot:4500389-Pyramimonas_sp.AAC.2
MYHGPYDSNPCTQQTMFASCASVYVSCVQGQSPQFGDGEQKATAAMVNGGPWQVVRGAGPADAVPALGIHSWT